MMADLRADVCVKKLGALKKCTQKKKECKGKTDKKCYEVYTRTPQKHVDALPSWMDSQLRRET